MEDPEVHANLERHWATSDANDSRRGAPDLSRRHAARISAIGGRIRGKRNTEYILTYDGQPSCTGTIMEFLEGKAARESQYFGDPFDPGPSRAQWVERMP